MLWSVATCFSDRTRWLVVFSKLRWGCEIQERDLSQGAPERFCRSAASAQELLRRVQRTFGRSEMYRQKLRGYVFVVTRTVEGGGFLSLSQHFPWAFGVLPCFVYCFILINCSRCNSARIRVDEKVGKSGNCIASVEMGIKFRGICVRKSCGHLESGSATNTDVINLNSFFLLLKLFNFLLGLYKNCKEIKHALKTNQNKDYTMLVRGKPAVVYCYKMDTQEPEEYISLQVNTENYAEIYDRRLRNIDTCPYYGQRRDNCDCVQIGSERSGLTNFYKVRLNVTSLQIIGKHFQTVNERRKNAKIISGDIFTFSTQTKGKKKIPYGTAGDCYSQKSGCPQGRFSVDLTGTSFKISAGVRWRSHGYFSTAQVNIEVCSRLCVIASSSNVFCFFRKEGWRVSVEATAGNASRIHRWVWPWRWLSVSNKVRENTPSFLLPS